MTIFVLLFAMLLGVWIYSQEHYTSNIDTVSVQTRRMQYIKRIADDILRDLKSPSAPATVNETWYYGKPMNDIVKALKKVYPSKNIFPIEISVFQTARLSTLNSIMVVWQWADPKKTKRTVVQVVGMPPPMRLAIPNVIGLSSEDAVNSLKVANPGAIVRRVSTADSYSTDYMPNRLTVIHDATSNLTTHVIQN